MVNNNWLVTKRPRIDRLPKELYRVEFVEEIGDMITLLSRVFGLPSARIFHPWMYQFICIILAKKEFVDWATIISNTLHKQLIEVKMTGCFYMTSYLTYAVARRKLFSGLETRGVMGPSNSVFHYYPQLSFKNSSHHFRRVNDAFTFRVIRNLNRNTEERFSKEAMSVISQWGTWFIQFSSFSYIHVSGFAGTLWKLPKYIKAFHIKNPPDSFINDDEDVIDPSYDAVAFTPLPRIDWTKRDEFSLD
ncbi:hypothetical protein KI387_038244, partial [Taxus chinensis]